MIKTSTDRSRDSSSGKEIAESFLAIFVIGLVLVVVAGLITFPRIASGIFFSWDSGIYVTNAKDYLDDGTLTGLVASYTQSFGNLAYPFNYNLLPEVRLAYFGGLIHPVIMFIVASLLFFTSTFVLASMIGFGPLTALVSGLATVGLTMPITSPPMFSIIFWWFSPYSIPLVYQFSLLLVTIHCIGRFATIGNLLAILLLVFEVLWVNVGGAKGGIIVVMSAAFYGIAIATSSESIRVFGWRVLAALLVPLVLVLSGSLDYIAGIYSYSATLLLFSKMQTSVFDLTAFLQTLVPDLRPSYLKRVAEIWLYDQLGFPLTILSVVGVIWTILWPPTKMARHLAIAMIAISPFLLVFVYGQVVGSASYPLYVIFAIAGSIGVAGSLWTRLTQHFLGKQSASLRVAAPQAKEFLTSRWSPVVTIVVVTLILIVVARLEERVPGGWIYPPSRPPLIETMVSNIRFRPGDIFRGRYVDMSITAPLENGTVPKGTSLQYALMKTAYDHAVAYGNDLTAQGPRFYDVPVAMEYNRMTSPASVLFHSLLLVDEGQIENASIRAITHFDPRIFRLLGIRYALSHQPLDHEYANQIEVPKLPEGTSLYEIAGVNIGQYSPTEIAVMPDWQSALEKMASPDFDPRQTVIVPDNWAGTAPLGPATAQIMRTMGGYRVTASSSGRSLLILPFEFSRCLVVKEMEGAARIGRADFLLTGLVFEKKVDVELRFRFGPFENAGCRRADVADMRAMGLNSASFADFQKKYPRRFRYTEMF